MFPPHLGAALSEHFGPGSSNGHALTQGEAAACLACSPGGLRQLLTARKEGMRENEPQGFPYTSRIVQRL